MFVLEMMLAINAVLMLVSLRSSVRHRRPGIDELVRMAGLHGPDLIPLPVHEAKVIAFRSRDQLSQLHSRSLHPSSGVS